MFSYQNQKVHRLMLEDRPRTLAYKNAIETNDAVKNKIVLGKDEIYKIKSNSKL